jgi:hypothetical protein
LPPRSRRRPQRGRGPADGDGGGQAADEQTSKRTGGTQEHQPRLGDAEKAGRHDASDEAKTEQTDYGSHPDTLSEGASDVPERPSRPTAADVSEMPPIVNACKGHEQVGSSIATWKILHDPSTR